MKSVNTWCNRIKRQSTDTTTNERGNRIYRTNTDTDRYIVDSADNFTAEGWQQFDTNQDANYFGVWVNPKTRQTLCYAEGDWMLVECKDLESYKATIRDTIAFYGEGCEARTIDAAGNMKVFRQDRSKFLEVEGE